MAENKHGWRALVNIVMILWFRYSSENLISSLGTRKSSKITVLHVLVVVVVVVVVLIVVVVVVVIVVVVVAVVMVEW